MKKIYLLSLVILGGISFSNAAKIKSSSTYAFPCKGHEWDDYYRPAENDSQSVRLAATPYQDESKDPAFELRYTGGELSINWYNITDACGITYIDTKVEKISDNHLDISLVSDDSLLADCLCLFDAYSYIKGIEPGEYVLTLLGQDFKVTLEEGFHKMLILNYNASEDGNYITAGADSSDCQHKAIIRKEYSEDNDGPVDEDYYRIYPYYGVEYNNGHLKVTWYNLSANCAAKFRNGSLTREGDTLSFNVVQVYASDLATCFCSYDVSAEFDGIEPGNYKLKFYDKEFDIELTENTKENLYPRGILSGIEAVNGADNAMLLGSDKVLKINTEADYALDIFNVDGLKITSLSGNGSDELDLNSLPIGVYLLRLTTGGRTVTRRIML